MPPNVLDLVGDIREAVDRLPREQLVEVLTYVFKEYVIEGPAPLSAGPAAFQDELQGLSFADLVRSLQLRLDLPELELFEVQGERVTIRVQGRALPIEAGAARAEPGPAPPAADPVRAAVARAVPAAAPPPAAALQQGNAAAQQAAPAAQQGTAAAQPGQAAVANATGAAASTPPASGTPAGRAGGLLEID